MAGKADSRCAETDTIYQVLWPGGRKAKEKIVSFAKRPKTLSNKTVGLLWNGRFRGDEIFSLLSKCLSNLYPGIKLVSWTEFPRDGEHGVPDWEKHPNLLAEKGCEAVILATGA